jgi:putative FmdB family regulatory protein|tara:strand:- start:25780 stop:25965 length:186 start_codon:yes stop_codon:yes gene_type:complete
MPLYVFKCEDCGKRIEKLMPFDGPTPSCEHCLCEMKKQIAATSFTLKGSGWAKDNYGLKSD